MQYNTADQPDFNCISKQLNWNFPQRDNEDWGLHRSTMWKEGVKIKPRAKNNLREIQYWWPRDTESNVNIKYDAFILRKYNYQVVQADVQLWLVIRSGFSGFTMTDLWLNLYFPPLHFYFYPPLYYRAQYRKASEILERRK